MMSYKQITYDVLEESGVRHEDVLCTPALIQQGTVGWTMPRFPVEAYRMGIEQMGNRMVELWRMRDDSYDPPGTEYVRVRVEAVER